MNLIELRIDDPAQLFNPFDPAPPNQRGLNHELMKYLEQKIGESPRSSSYKIVVHLSRAAERELSAGQVKEVLRGHFTAQIKTQWAAFKSFAERAQYYVVIGGTAAAAAILTAQQLPYPGEDAVGGSLRIGMFLVAGVVIWRPIEAVMFEWYPYFEKIRFYRKLTSAPVDVTAD